MSAPESNNSRRRLWLIVLILSLLLLMAGGVTAFLLFRTPAEKDPDPKSMTNPPSPSSPSDPSSDTAPRPTDPTEPDTTDPEPTEPELPENPVDFEGYWEINTDVCAFLYVPMNREGDSFDYDIRLPILQPRTADDDNFYLHHNIHRKYQFSGELYFQKKNSKDFTDRVTVIYGHNMLNRKIEDTRFTNLLDFRSQDFFDTHEYFYIYLPGHILTYRIAAATPFDTRHILNNFDFSDDHVYQEWINNYVLNPRVVGSHSRQDQEVTIDDKIVILSTCMDRGTRRYLVEGVLISDEPTK